MTHPMFQNILNNFTSTFSEKKEDKKNMNIEALNEARVLIERAKLALPMGDEGLRIYQGLDALVGDINALIAQEAA